MAKKRIRGKKSKTEKVKKIPVEKPRKVPSSKKRKGEQTRKGSVGKRNTGIDKRSRSESAKRGWETRRKHQAQLKSQIELESEALRLERMRLDLEQKASELWLRQKALDKMERGIRTETAQAQAKLLSITEEVTQTQEKLSVVKAQLDITKLEQELALFNLSETYRERDHLYEKRRTIFSEEQYNRLLIAESMGNFHEAASDMLDELNVDNVSEIYDYWRSP